MSTLNTTPTLDRPSVDHAGAGLHTRFDTVVRHANETAPAETEFGTAFDLDYGQRRLDTAVPRQRSVTPERRGERARTLHVVQPQRRRSAVRLTRRGRLAATTLFVGTALGVLLSTGGLAAGASLDAGTPAPVRVVTVQPGDTLYAIASDLAAPGEIRAMVLRIQELNSLPSASISEGQKLAVPRG